MDIIPIIIYEYYTQEEDQRPRRSQSESDKNNPIFD